MHQSEAFCFSNGCASKITAEDSMLSPVLQLLPVALRDPKCPGQTSHHPLPTSKKTDRKEALCKRGHSKIMERLPVSDIATAIKPLMIWKLVLEHTIALTVSQIISIEH